MLTRLPIDRPEGRESARFARPPFVPPPQTPFLWTKFDAGNPFRLSNQSHDLGVPVVADDHRHLSSNFSRFWSVRNLDLAALIAFTPGLLLIYYGLDAKTALPAHVQAGYVWLFAVSGFFLIRMLLDPVMVRRPLLEPNLSVSGLTFTGVSLLVFLMANVINLGNDPHPERLETLLSKPEEPKAAQPSPGYRVFYQLAGFSGKALAAGDETQPEAYRREVVRIAAARTAAILAPPGGGDRLGVDRLPAFRQPPHRRGDRHPLPALLLHQPDDRAGRSCGPGRPFGLGDRRLPPPARRRHAVWVSPPA